MEKGALRNASALSSPPPFSGDIRLSFESGSPGSATEAEELSQNDWLLRAENDNARFRLLQQQMRGFDQPMGEVGERFERLHDALQRENYEIAVYHWDRY